MDELVEHYFLNEKKISFEDANYYYHHLQRHPAIFKEFLYWVYTGKYINKVCIEGYTAKDIYALAHHLDGMGVFNFLITLKENPLKGHEIICDGFKRK